MDNEGIKASCPFCGAPDLEAIELMIFPAGEDPDIYAPEWVVACQNCAANGPPGGSKTEAVENWNGRTDMLNEAKNAIKDFVEKLETIRREGRLQEVTEEWRKRLLRNGGFTYETTEND